MTLSNGLCWPWSMARPK